MLEKIYDRFNCIWNMPNFINIKNYFKYLFLLIEKVTLFWKANKMCTKLDL